MEKETQDGGAGVTEAPADDGITAEQLGQGLTDEPLVQPDATDGQVEEKPATQDGSEERPQDEAGSDAEIEIDGQKHKVSDVREALQVRERFTENAQAYKRALEEIQPYVQLREFLQERPGVIAKLKEFVENDGREPEKPQPAVPPTTTAKPESPEAQALRQEWAEYKKQLDALKYKGEEERTVQQVKTEFSDLRNKYAELKGLSDQEWQNHAKKVAGFMLERRRAGSNVTADEAHMILSYSSKIALAKEAGAKEALAKKSGREAKQTLTLDPAKSKVGKQLWTNDEEWERTLKEKLSGS